MEMEFGHVIALKLNVYSQAKVSIRVGADFYSRSRINRSHLRFVGRQLQSHRRAPGWVAIAIQTAHASRYLRRHRQPSQQRCPLRLDADYAVHREHVASAGLLH
jgi:hypothetical protein